MNNKYLIPALASVLVLTMLLSSFMPVMAVIRPTIGPKLDVVTIPEDDQKREKGIIVLGLTPDATGRGKGYAAGQDLLSQHKLLVSYNGQLIYWRIGDSPIVVACNVLEKDKVNPIKDKFGTPTRQFPEENLVTKLIDVSDKFICKVRWKNPAGMLGYEESVGVLDVYYVGPALPTMIADNILLVTVSLVIGRTIIMGSDMQDICVLGYSMSPNYRDLTLPDGGEIYRTFADSLGPFVSCEEAALYQRFHLGLAIEGVVQSA